MCYHDRIGAHENQAAVRIGGGILDKARAVQRGQVFATQQLHRHLVPSLADGGGHQRFAQILGGVRVLFFLGGVSDGLVIWRPQTLSVPGPGSGGMRAAGAPGPRTLTETLR